MQSEFEGRTEQEAIDKAIRELGLDRDAFDVEIVEREKKGSCQAQRRCSHVSRSTEKSRSLKNP